MVIRFTWQELREILADAVAKRIGATRVTAHSIVAYDWRGEATLLRGKEVSVIVTEPKSHAVRVAKTTTPT